MPNVGQATVVYRPEPWIYSAIPNFLQAGAGVYDAMQRRNQAQQNFKLDFMKAFANESPDVQASAAKSLNVKNYTPVQTSGAMTSQYNEQSVIPGLKTWAEGGTPGAPTAGADAGQSPSVPAPAPAAPLSQPEAPSTSLPAAPSSPSPPAADLSAFTTAAPPPTPAPPTADLSAFQAGGAAPQSVDALAEQAAHVHESMRAGTPTEVLNTAPAPLQQVFSKTLGTQPELDASRGRAITSSISGAPATWDDTLYRHLQVGSLLNELKSTGKISPQSMDQFNVQMGMTPEARQNYYQAKAAQYSLTPEMLNATMATTMGLPQTEAQQKVMALMSPQQKAGAVQFVMGDNTRIGAALADSMARIYTSQQGEQGANQRQAATIQANREEWQAKLGQSSQQFAQDLQFRKAAQDESFIRDQHQFDLGMKRQDTYYQQVMGQMQLRDRSEQRQETMNYLTQTKAEAQNAGTEWARMQASLVNAYKLDNNHQAPLVFKAAGIQAQLDRVQASLTGQMQLTPEQKAQAQQLYMQLNQQKAALSQQLNAVGITGSHQEEILSQAQAVEYARAKSEAADQRLTDADARARDFLLSNSPTQRSASGPQGTPAPAGTSQPVSSGNPQVDYVAQHMLSLDDPAAKKYADDHKIPWAQVQAAARHRFAAPPPALTGGGFQSAPSMQVEGQPPMAPITAPTPTPTGQPAQGPPAPVGVQSGPQTPQPGGPVQGPPAPQQTILPTQGPPAPATPQAQAPAVPVAAPHPQQPSGVLTQTDVDQQYDSLPPIVQHTVESLRGVVSQVDPETAQRLGIPPGQVPVVNKWLSAPPPSPAPQREAGLQQRVFESTFTPHVAQQWADQAMALRFLPSTDPGYAGMRKSAVNALAANYVKQAGREPDADQMHAIGRYADQAMDRVHVALQGRVAQDYIPPQGVDPTSFLARKIVDQDIRPSARAPWLADYRLVAPLEAPRYPAESYRGGLHQDQSIAPQSTNLEKFLVERKLYTPEQIDSARRLADMMRRQQTH